MLKDKEAEEALEVLAKALGWDAMSTDEVRILAAATMAYFAQRLNRDLTA